VAEALARSMNRAVTMFPFAISDIGFYLMLFVYLVIFFVGPVENQQFCWKTTLPIRYDINETVIALIVQ